MGVERCGSFEQHQENALTRRRRRGILAGGETTGMSALKLFQPLRGERLKLRSGALPGREFPLSQVPVVSPPANIRRPSGTKNENRE